MNINKNEVEHLDKLIDLLKSENITNEEINYILIYAQGLVAGKKIAINKK